MEKKTRITVVGIIAAIIIITIGIGIAVIKKLTPSNEVMLLTDYYQVEDSEVMIILQDEIYEKQGVLADGKVYIDYDTVVNEFNHRFYWDYNENILTYTTPTEIIQAEAADNKYTVTKSMIKTDTPCEYSIIKLSGDKVYIALDFVQQYSDMKYSFYVEPNRVVINYKWGDYLFTQVTKATQLRSEPNIKSPVLVQLPVGEELMYMAKDEAPNKGFVKVMTSDGVIGYVKQKHIKDSYYKTIESTYQPEEYTSQLKMPSKHRKAERPTLFW